MVQPTITFHANGVLNRSIQSYAEDGEIVLDFNGSVDVLRLTPDQGEALVELLGFAAGAVQRDSAADHGDRYPHDPFDF